MEKRKLTGAKSGSIYDDCFTPEWGAIEDIDSDLNSLEISVVEHTLDAVAAVNELEKTNILDASAADHLRAKLRPLIDDYVDDDVKTEDLPDVYANMEWASEYEEYDEDEEYE